MKLQIAITLAALAIGGSAFAQEPAGGGGAGGGGRPAPTPEMQAARQAVRQACAADMKTLCDGKEGREAMMCMRDNASKVSQACSEAMMKMRASRQPPPAS